MGTFKFKYNCTNYIYVENCKYIEDNCTYKNAVEVSKAFEDSRLLNEVLSAAHCSTIIQIPQKPDDLEITLEGDRFAISGVTEDEQDTAAAKVEEVADTQEAPVQEQVVTEHETATVNEESKTDLPEFSDITPAHKTTDSIMMLGEPLPPQGLFECKSTIHASKNVIDGIDNLHKEEKIAIVNSVLQDLAEYEFQALPRVQELVSRAHDSGYKQGATTAEQYKELWLKAKKQLKETGAEVTDTSVEQPSATENDQVLEEPVASTSVQKVAEKYGVPAVLLSSCKAYTTRDLMVDDIKESTDLKNDLYSLAEAEHWAYFDGWYAVDVVTSYYRLFVNFDTNKVVSIPVEEIQNITQG